MSLTSLSLRQLRNRTQNLRLIGSFQYQSPSPSFGPLIEEGLSRMQRSLTRRISPRFQLCVEVFSTSKAVPSASQSCASVSSTLKVPMNDQELGPQNEAIMEAEASPRESTCSCTGSESLCSGIQCNYVSFHLKICKWIQMWARLHC